MGYYKAKKLKYAGMVGTGYDNKLLRDLGKKLRDIERDEPAFSRDSSPKKTDPGSTPNWFASADSPAGPAPANWHSPCCKTCGRATYRTTPWGIRHETRQAK